MKKRPPVFLPGDSLKPLKSIYMDFTLIDAEVICISQNFTPRPEVTDRRMPEIGDRLYTTIAFSCDCGCGARLYQIPDYPKEYWPVNCFSTPKPLSDPALRRGKPVLFTIGDFKMTDVLLSAVFVYCVNFKTDLPGINMDVLYALDRFGQLTNH